MAVMSKLLLESNYPPSSEDSAACKAEEAKRRLSRVAQGAIKDEAKAKLLKGLFDIGVGTKTVEKMAALNMAERRNAEGGRGSRRGRGRRKIGCWDGFSPQDGCARDPDMVRDILLPKLRHARTHERASKRDFKFVRRAIMADLSEEERREVTSYLHSQRDKMRTRMNAKKEEKILHLTRAAHDCSRHHLCSRIKEDLERQIVTNQKRIKVGSGQ